MGHDGATPESSWLLEEITIIVPTKGVMYTFVCKCWLARDKGDGLTWRIFNILDADTVFIGVKVSFLCLVTLRHTFLPKALHSLDGAILQDVALCVVRIQFQGAGNLKFKKGG